MIDAMWWAGATFYITESIKVFADRILYPYILYCMIREVIRADSKNKKEVQR